MEQQNETVDQTQSEQPVEVPAKSPVLSSNEALFLFLACTGIGFIGVLIGFVPLIALAMIGPIVVAFLA